MSNKKEVIVEQEVVQNQEVEVLESATIQVPTDEVSTNIPDVEPIKEGRSKYRIRYDFDTGYVLLRVSTKTEPRKLGGAIVKHFKDGAKALVVSFIGLNTMSIALKGICAAQEYLPKESLERLSSKKLAIVPEFHEFENDNGKVNTMKFTLYLVDELSQS